MSTVDDQPSHQARDPSTYSKPLPPIDVKILPATRDLANTLLPSNSFSERTHDDEHEVNLSLDVNEEELSLNSHLQSYYQPSPANSLHSMHSIDRSSPSSLLLHQSVTSYPNVVLPSLQLNDSKTPEENILCALEPSPAQRQDTPIYSMYNNKFPVAAVAPTKPKLLREAAKSEPAYPTNQRIQHIKSSKSLHHNNISNLHHITSQPPPMPSYYLHRAHKSHTLSNLSLSSALSNTSPIYSPLHSKHESMNFYSHSMRSRHHKHYKLNAPKRPQHVRFDTQPQRIVAPMVSKLIPKSRHLQSHSGNQEAYALDTKKKKKKKGKKMQRSETPQPVYNNKKNAASDDKQVHVMRDEEVLQIDEEIPIEKFISALKKGYARIMTEDDQNEEYTRSARIARSVSVGNMQAYKDEILAEREERRKIKEKKYNKKTKKKRKKTKSKTPNYKHMKLVRQRVDSVDEASSDSSSIDGSLVGPPQENELLMTPNKRNRNKKLTRSQTHENRDRVRKHDIKVNEKRPRSRSKTSKPMKDEVQRVRHRPNSRFASRRSENDDVLDMIADESSSDFSSDSDLSSCSTDHDCEMVKVVKPKKVVKVEDVLPPTPSLNHTAKSMNDVRSALSPKFKIIKNLTYDTDDEDHEDSIDKLVNGSDSDYDFVDREIYSESGNHLTAAMYTNIEKHNPLKLAIVDEMRQRSLSNEHKEKEEAPMRARALSNESASSNTSVSSVSSCSSSSSSASSDWDQEVREEEEEAVRQQRRANGISSDDDEEGTATESESEESEPSELATSSDSDNESNDTNHSADSALTETENLTESESEPECDPNGYEYDESQAAAAQTRPQSTPFRSSKGTAVFLSHLKKYRNNDLRLRTGGNDLNQLINLSRGRSEHIAMSKATATATATAKRKNMAQHDSIQIQQTTPMKMKKLTAKQMTNRENYGMIQKRKNALKAYAKVNV